MSGGITPEPRNTCSNLSCSSRYLGWVPHFWVGTLIPIVNGSIAKIIVRPSFLQLPIGIWIWSAAPIQQPKYTESPARAPLQGDQSGLSLPSQPIGFGVDGSSTWSEIRVEV